MSVRKVIEIDDEKCDGCGECIPNCPEGALQVIDGKARLISDIFCDGLGACIGECPKGAISTVEREAVAYDEKKVMENIIGQGENVIIAHLKHLRDHNEIEFFKEALSVLKEKGIDIPAGFIERKIVPGPHAGCPGSKEMSFNSKDSAVCCETEEQPSALTQWPVQLHLVSPHAAYFAKSDVLLAADCVAFTVGNFHSGFLKGKSLAIACPKLDSGKEIYIEKIRALIDDANVNTITVMMMQVPCCMGLMAIVKESLEKAERKVPLKKIVVGIQGDIISDEWV
jgi:Pyruvate/2-oxoacid:ferredoxin oxidoreductase delta subunit